MPAVANPEHPTARARQPCRRGLDRQPHLPVTLGLRGDDEVVHAQQRGNPDRVTTVPHVGGLLLLLMSQSAEWRGLRHPWWTL